MVDTHQGSPYSHVERFINITVETKATLNSLLSWLTVKSQITLPVTIPATTLTRSRSKLYSWVQYTFTDLRTTGIKFRCYHPAPLTSSLCGGRQREGNEVTDLNVVCPSLTSPVISCGAVILQLRNPSQRLMRCSFLRRLALTSLWQNTHLGLFLPQNDKAPSRKSCTLP